METESSQASVLVSSVELPLPF